LQKFRKENMGKILTLQIGKLKNILTLFKIQKEEKVLDAVLRSSFINLLARLLGYFKNVAIAVLLGFSSQTDAFFMALSLIGILLIFGDVFDSVGVPNLVRARLESKEVFKKLTGLLLTFTLILASSVTLIGLIIYPLIMKIPIGFKGKVLDLTENSFLLLLPYTFFYFIFHHFGAVLRSVRRFTHFFVGEFIFAFFNFLFITVGLLLYKEYWVLPLSFSIAQFIGSLYLIYVGKEFIHLHLYWDEKVKLILKHFIQLSFLYGVFYLFIVVDRAFASLLGEKAVSALAYGLMIAGALKGVLKFENIAITSLSESGGDLNKLNYYLKKLLLITLPTTLFLFIFSKIAVKLLLGYGAFSHLDIELTATALRYYALSLPFMFFWPIIYRVFQIKEELKKVSFLAIVGVVLNGLFNYLFVIKLQLGIMGVCLGTFFAYLFLCLSGYFMLKSSQ